MRIGLYGAVAVSLLTAACGTDTTQRAASGGIAGVAVGALAGGPVGAIVGAAVGGFGGWAMPEGAETLAGNVIRKEKQVSRSALNSVGMGTVASGASPSAAEVKRAQTELQREGLYRGPIDGIMGRDTRNALTDYQGREGLRQTATLDRATMERLNASIRTAQNPEQERSGSSAPPEPQQQPPQQPQDQQEQTK
jgi:Putative peptidoglycan binding domain